MKHILIDARLYGPKHTGIGRYTKNLLLALKTLDNFKKYKFTLLVYPELLEEVKTDLGDSYCYVSTNLRHYSVQEQLALPFLISSLKPDLVHFTHLDKPIFYTGKSVVTVHDLIRHFSKGKDTTTKNPGLYWLKYLGYLFMTQVITLQSYIIVPSDFWRDYIIKKFNFSQKKIVTTHEAVDPNFFQSEPYTNTKPSSYILYTGNLYPHKNIQVILKALHKLPDLTLKIICARSLFSQRIESLAKELGVSTQVDFLGYIPDPEFRDLYKNALALVHPAFIEGFSLTGLEAMALNCPVIASNTTCMPEIYGNSVLYFDPNSVDELVSQVQKLSASPKLRRQLITKGQTQVKKYTWSKTAALTFDFYESIIKS